jgi:hypothetical protein
LTLPPVAFTSSNQYQIDSAGQLIGGIHPDLLTHNSYREIATISLHKPFWVWATTSSMMFRRAVLHYVLADDDEQFRKCADNYICHFCNLLGRSILIPVILGCYRRHQRNAFSNNPLIGGRLPTGDMRYHPTHDVVLASIRARLLECREEFVALLGLVGFLHVLSQVTPWWKPWHCGAKLRRSPGISFAEKSKLYAISGLLCLRRIVRTLKNHYPSFTMADLENTKSAAKLASYADYQRYRRDAK